MDGILTGSYRVKKKRQKGLYYDGLAVLLYLFRRVDPKAGSRNRS
jgi:hypothetical protein